jgi:DNA-directed RNA polymerase subunit N (RpoN/RPB10)
MRGPGTPMVSIASVDEQRNTAFQIRSDRDDNIEDEQDKDVSNIRLVCKDGIPKWCVRRLILFLDRHDEPYLTKIRDIYFSIAVAFIIIPITVYKIISMKNINVSIVSNTNENNGIPKWCVRRLILFLDRHDEPYLTEKFFFSTCYMDTIGVPGPLIQNMMHAL